ncbi:MAG: glycosyltransferase [Bacteroidetes bacterium]|nr:glycosyltransferase [Bacteroidota bacterium]
MEFSIITVTKNNGSTIEQTIQSVLNQSFRDFEYIVIDGLSSDNTSEILQKYSHRISKIVSEKDDGIYFAMNKGIMTATGDIIGFIHGDDFFPDSEVLTHVADLLDKSGADAVYSDLVYVHKNNPRKIFRYWKSGPYREGLFLKGWMPPNPTFFCKREIYMNYGFFNTSFRISADYELMLRFMHRHKIKPAYLPEVTVHMRAGGKSNISILSRLKANREDRRAWEVNGLTPSFLTLYLKPAIKIKQYWSRG